MSAMMPAAPQATTVSGLQSACCDFLFLKSGRKFFYHNYIYDSSSIMAPECWKCTSSFKRSCADHVSING